MIPSIPSIFFFAGRICGYHGNKTQIQQKILFVHFGHLQTEVLLWHFPEVLPDCFRCQRGIWVRKWRRLVALPSSNNNKTYPPHQGPTPVPSLLQSHPQTPAALRLVGSRKASGIRRSPLKPPLCSSAPAAAAPARAALARLPPAGAVVRAPLPTPVVPVLETVSAARVGLSGSCLRPAGMGTCLGWRDWWIRPM